MKPRLFANHSTTDRAARVLITLVVGTALATALASCSNEPEHATSSTPTQTASVAAERGRGELVRVEDLATLTRAQAQRRLRRAGWGSEPLRTGVRAFRLTYRTVDVAGKPTTATGLVALPDDHTDTTEPLTAVVYTHGTTSYRKGVASQWRDPYDDAPAVLIAGSGMAAVLPDYLGLGGGPGRHPWMHVATETSASVDMLRAAQSLTQTEGVALRPEVAAIGFSQGASAAIGLSRALTSNPSLGFTVRQTFGISGGYDFAGSEIPAMLDGSVPQPVAVPYVTYLLVAWNRIWPLYGSAEHVFRAPYAGRVERLFDGDTPGPRMISELPHTLRELLTPHGLELLEEPNAALRTGLEQADAVCDWNAPMPVTLFYAEDDEQAVAHNTTACAESLQQAGATPTVESLGKPALFGSRHIGTNVAGTELAVQRLR